MTISDNQTDLPPAADDHTNKRPKRLSRTVLYESRWVNLYRDRVALPTGTILEQYHIVDFGPGAACVIVEDPAGNILLERIARYPTGITSWELPAGGIEPAEPILAAAAREVLEETGYQTHSHRLLQAYNPLNGISNFNVFVVHCLVGERSGQIDPNEIQSIRWFSPAETWHLLRNKQISDGLTLVGLLLHLNKLDQEAPMPGSQEKETQIQQLSTVFEQWQTRLARLSEAEICAPGHFEQLSIKDVIAHLTCWQIISVARLEAALAGSHPTMPAWHPHFDTESPEELHQVNAFIFAENHSRPWPDIQSEWQARFQHLLQLAESLPAADLSDPSRYAWMMGYPLSAVLLGSYEHHLEHLEELLAG